MWLSSKKYELTVVNKNTKIWINYTVGICISLFLLCSIYIQVRDQAARVGKETWRQSGPQAYLWWCIVLMFVNTSLEGAKWYLLVRSVAPVRYAKAFASYLVGVAFSIITPNRIGEYPGRILYIAKGSTSRYINVSVLGVMSQLSGVYLFGLMGLVYYYFAFPGVVSTIALGGCLIANILLGVVYWRFEAWLPLLAKIKWIKRFAVYGKLLQAVTLRRQLTIFGVSLLRVCIFTAQYLFLLRWLNVEIPLAAGFCMCALFFWIMAIIPSLAFTGFAARMKVGTILFAHFSTNTQGILAATAGLWVLNLVVPSILGSILIMKMRLLR